jgi:hypothetical protein
VQGSTYQVHAITCTGDQADVADCVQCTKLGEWERLVHEMDRHKVNCPESPVDPSNKLINRGAQVLVFFHILSGGNRELNQNNLREWNR